MRAFVVEGWLKVTEARDARNGELGSIVLRVDSPAGLGATMDDLRRFSDRASGPWDFRVTVEPLGGDG